MLTPKVNLLLRMLAFFGFLKQKVTSAPYFQGQLIVIKITITKTFSNFIF
jgi:hypothetical protein